MQARELFCENGGPRRAVFRFLGAGQVPAPPLIDGMAALIEVTFEGPTLMRGPGLAASPILMLSPNPM